MLKYLVLVTLVCWSQTTTGQKTAETFGKLDTYVDQLFLRDKHVPQNNTVENSTADTSAMLVNGLLNYYVAQQIIYVQGPEQFKRQMTSNVRSDYTVTPGIGAHKIHAASYNWNNARKVCIEEGAHLAIVNSNAEEALFLKMLKEKDLDAVWLGIHDLYEENEWVTVLDQSLLSTGYTKWTTHWPNEPDGGTYQNCGVLTIHGGLDDGTCSLGYPFICEIPITAYETANPPPFAPGVDAN